MREVLISLGRRVLVAGAALFGVVAPVTAQQEVTVVTQTYEEQVSAHDAFLRARERG